MTTKQINIRLSEPGQRLLAELAELYGSQTKAVELAIDRLYREEVIQMTDWYEQAQHRVDSVPELKAHKSTIMYDWDEGTEHWQWVATAPVAEIVDWAETIEKA